MAAPTVPVSVFNWALAAMGQEPVVAITGATKSQRLYMRNWDRIRRDALADGVWNFNRKQVQLAAETTPPLFGNRQRFKLPADFIRLYDTEELDLDGWKLHGDASGRYIHADTDGPLDLVYGYDCVDWELYDAKFLPAAGQKVAAFLSPSVLQSEGRTQSIETRADRKVGEARLVDTQNDSPEEWDQDVWLGSRF